MVSGDVHRAVAGRGEQRERVAEPLGVEHLRRVVGRLGEQVAQQLRVAGVVLDEQDHRRAAHELRGSFTTVNQNCSIDRTIVMNWSRSTGFVT